MSMRPLFAVYSRDNQFEAHEKSVRVMYFIPREAASNIAVQKGICVQSRSIVPCEAASNIAVQKGICVQSRSIVPCEAASNIAVQKGICVPPTTFCRVHFKSEAVAHWQIRKKVNPLAMQ